jgi:hypothetical protein
MASRILHQELLSISIFGRPIPMALTTLGTVHGCFDPVLNGNMSMLPYTCNDSSNQPSVCLMQTAASSQILQTSIAACPEIWNYWWYNNIKFFGLNPILPQPTINCRNESVMAALEDLAANMTISLLSFNLSDSLKPIPLFPITDRTPVAMQTSNMPISLRT